MLQNGQIPLQPSPRSSSHQQPSSPAAETRNAGRGEDSQGRAERACTARARAARVRWNFGSKNAIQSRPYTLRRSKPPLLRIKFPDKNRYRIPAQCVPPSILRAHARTRARARCRLIARASVERRKEKYEPAMFPPFSVPRRLELQQRDEEFHAVTDQFAFPLAPLARDELEHRIAPSKKLDAI